MTVENGVDPVAEPTPADRARLTHYASIGNVASFWALLEIMVDARAIALAQISDIAYGFTAQIAGSGRKIDAYIAVARERGIKKRTIELLNEFAKDAAGLAERRNRIVHDPWLLEDGKVPQRMEITARKILKSGYVPVSTEKVLELIGDIQRLELRFLELDSAIVAEVAALPEKPQPTSPQQ